MTHEKAVHSQVGSMFQSRQGQTHRSADPPGDCSVQVVWGGWLFLCFLHAASFTCWSSIIFSTRTEVAKEAATPEPTAIASMPSHEGAIR